MTVKRVMIDLETLGVTAGCSILSIGAATFDEHRGVGDPFYATISRKTCRNAGLVEDADTLIWWHKQSEEARKVLTADHTTLPLGLALAQFHDYLSRFHTSDVLVYGNGADFDLPILGRAFLACGFDLPWKAYNGRCYRTLKNQRPDVKLVRTPGTHHNALSDATAQAEHAIRILTELNLWGMK